jgi:hypothetical protein
VDVVKRAERKRRQRVYRERKGRELLAELIELMPPEYRHYHPAMGRPLVCPGDEHHPPHPIDMAPICADCGRPMDADHG